MDVLASLPPELVAIILVLLPPEDLVRCLHVSRAWRELAGSFRHLWMRHCVEFGVPDYRVGKDGHPLHVFLAARRQRNYIARCTHRSYADVRSRGVAPGNTHAVHPADSELRACQVVHAGHGVIVAVLYELRARAQESSSGDESPDMGAMIMWFFPFSDQVKPYKLFCIQIERLNDVNGKTEMLCRVKLDEECLWPFVSQAFAAKDGSWVILSVKGVCTGTTAWYKIELSPAAPGLSRELKLPEFSLYHQPSISYDIACCSQCSILMLVKNKRTMRPPWQCSIDTVDMSAISDEKVEEHVIPIASYDKMRLSSDVHANVVFRPTLICSESAGDLLQCSSHNLILWRTNDHTIFIHGYTSEEGVSEKPLATFSPVPQGRTMETSTAWGHAKLKTSSDNELLGFLMSHYLHVWSLKSYDKLVIVFLHGISPLISQFLSLGHMYTLFGKFDGGDSLVLLSTRTGEVVWECLGFDELQKSRYSMVYNYNTFGGVVRDDWMSSVYTTLPSQLPLVLYIHQRDQQMDMVALASRN